MRHSILPALLFLLPPLSASSATQGREYNTWYEKDAVLYDLVQTSTGQPVMLSFSQPGQDQANLVISEVSVGECKTSRLLRVNGHVVPAGYVCARMGKDQVEHFTVTDAGQVNNMVHLLQSDFTLLLQGDIKVWAANVKNPKYGVAPHF
jgi:hypothetical protein